MIHCAPHREYLAAIADRELELVPPATLEHVKDCADCTREIRAHQLLSSRLRQASDLMGKGAPERPPIAWSPGRVGLVAAATAIAILASGAGAWWFVQS